MNVEVSELKDFATLNPKPQFIFVDVEIDYKFASTLEQYGVTVIKPPLKLSTTQTAIDVCMSNISKLYELYSQLIDDESRKTLCGYWLARVTRKFSEINVSSTPHYICAGFTPKTNDVVIDGGACDGATAAFFADMGCKVYAFEMDQRNYELAVPLAGQKNFVVENFGLGAFNCKMNFVRSDKDIGSSTLVLDGDQTAQIVSLDSYVAEHHLSSVDFIKLDVEGAEIDVLKGAATSIARWKPILAISAYHKLDDFWKLATLIKSIRPDYEFAMRHYDFTSEDVPYFFNEQRRKLLETHGLGCSLITIAECVLLAR